jgi:ribosome-associated protein
MASTSFELARVAAMAADEKKARDLLLIDLTDVSDVCDYFLIMTANNARQADTLVDDIKLKVSDNCNEKPLSIEGRAGGNWVLVDYGALVVHIFLQETREYYRLERLWGDAPRVSLGLESEMADEQAWAAGASDDQLADPDDVRAALVTDIDAEDDLDFA